MAISLKTVIAELSFINQLATDSPKDSRLKQLLEDAQTDLATIAKEIEGNDPLIRK